MRAIASILMSRGAGFVPLLFLGVWLLAVLVAGLDMAIVWIGQLQGAGEPGDVYVAMSERLGLLALFGASPPLLAWAIWRATARLARMRFGSAVSGGATP